ncbi:oligopeptide ABC transporter substrate-binding protein [Shouchella clausii]|uniref:oligopeptide ABC transporter substrate-binding protein n=1 Tax=Shouchella clausii TaxID=79880 RepID=UPI0021484F5E|nr:oligopeptide ABC transporter substrate-binding protein [Shouchella clausii]MCR1289666.1 oligopeptide ABC transporter substrate-binding protein [Shouchella clausii]
MKKYLRSGKVQSVAIASLLLLAACGGDETSSEGGNNSSSNNDGNGSSEQAGDIFSIEDFNHEIRADGEEIIDGGTLNVALVTDTPFEGTLNRNFYQGVFDGDILFWTEEPLLDIDEDYQYTQTGAATFEVDDDGRTFTFTIRDEVNWSDGEPVKAEDWAYTFEVLGHPDYPGVRFTEASNVEGFDEYRAGEADSISGLEIIDDKTLKITFKEASPSLLASGIWAYAMPKHIFEDIEVADMESSPAVRENPVFFGPYVIDSITPGENVVMKKNENYWRGEPNVDEVVFKTVNPNVLNQALQNGEVDIATYQTDQYADNYESLTNVDFIGKIDLAYTYIGFQMGTWDEEENKNVMDPDKQVSDVNLRKAMAHAVDNNAVGERFYNGFRWAGTTLIPPSHPTFHNDELEGFAYDVELANQILDDAGYEDVDGDGLREDPNGEKLQLNFASMSGGDTAEPLAQYYITQWKNIGIDVQLLDGRLQEFNTFYDRLKASDQDIDVYQGAWGVGSDADPYGLWGSTAAFNYTRWTNEESDRLLKEGTSEAALDMEYRQEVYNEWQELMLEEVPAFPTLYRSELHAVNKRVVNYSELPGSEFYNDRSQIGLTAEEPETAN